MQRGRKKLTYPDGVKKCSDCKQTKPVDEYYRVGTKTDTLQAYCKACNHRRRTSARVRSYSTEVLQALYTATEKIQRERKRELNWRREGFLIERERGES